MKKIISIIKYPFHIIYLIGGYIFKAIKSVALFIVKIFKSIFSVIFKGFKYIFGKLIPSIFKAIIIAFKKIGIYIYKFFKLLFNIIKKIFVAIYKGIKTIFTYLYKGIKTVFTYLYKGIKAAIKFIYKEAIILGKAFYKGAKWLIINLIKLLVNIAKFIINETIILAKYFYNGMVVVITVIVHNVIKISVAVYKFTVKVIKAIPIYVKKAIKKAVKELKKVFKEFTDIFRYAVLGVYLIFMGIFYDIPKAIIAYIPKLLHAAKESIKDWWLLLKQNLGEIPGKVKNSISDKLNNNIIVKSYRNKKLLQFENLTEMKIDKNSMDAVRSANKITFRYLVKNADGKFIKGYFSAFSKLDCHSYLLDEGYEVYKIETSKWIEFTHGESRFGNVVMEKKDLIFWLTQLSTYVRSGVPLTDATKILAAQDKRAKYKKIYDEIIYELTMGESFAKALEKQGKVFPALLVNMVKAAEMMGDIEDTLDDMALYYEDIENTKKQMKSAMAYPTIVAVFSIIIVVFILVYIIPKFEGIYDQAGAKMNGATLFVLNASYFLKAKWWIILLIIAGVIGAIIFLYKNLKAFKTVAQYLLMHMPVIGKVMIYNEMVLFSKTFASLQKNNVLLTDSIDILSKITDNEIYKVIMLDTITNLLKGDKMSDSFKDNWAIPELAYYMISTGERTGDLANMLDRVAKYYQEQQKSMVGTLKAFIEPIMIAGLAVVVGGIIIAAILPMFSMYGQLM